MSNILKLFYFCILFPINTQASITLNATRLVFKDSAGSASVEVSNANNDEPALVQSWVENYLANNSEDIPLIVSPSLAKIPPNGRQVLRVLGAVKSLPQDKESVFWLNVQYIPTQQVNAESQIGKNILQLAVRQRIKVFYRPAGLKGDVNKAPSLLVWQQSIRGNHAYITLTNPTPFCISYYGLKFQSHAKTHLVPDSGMLCSDESREFTAPAQSYRSLSFMRINDYGGDELITLAQ
ncbi:MAG: molecular chaperone [Enterobacteriaceae bacterium]|nr:molecular chaperone [Enterobacteriaceae bacterium]